MARIQVIGVVWAGIMYRSPRLREHVLPWRCIVTITVDATCILVIDGMPNNISMYACGQMNSSINTDVDVVSDPEPSCCACCQ